jgi:hypothetical protein
LAASRYGSDGEEDVEKSAELIGGGDSAVLGVLLVVLCYLPSLRRVVLQLSLAACGVDLGVGVGDTAVLGHCMACHPTLPVSTCCTAALQGVEWSGEVEVCWKVDVR